MLDNFRKQVIKELIIILQSLEDASELDIQQEVARLINNESGALYSKILFELSGLKIDRSENQRVFNEVLDHWYSLNTKLERDIGFKVAVLDYFLNINSKIKNPKIIPQEDLEQIKNATEKDRLTGLYNYGYFKKRLKEEIAISGRYNKYFSLVIIDIDDFKKYNDVYGHDQGNVVLENVAKILQDSVRDSDIVFRYGGEEFVLLLIETPKKGAYIVSDRARLLIQDLKNLKRQVTISVGVSTFPVDAKNGEELFELADKAMYTAKASGKNRVCLYHEERRIALRLPSQLALQLKVDNKDKETELKDISKTGAAFYIDEALEPGRLLEGKLVLSDEGQVKFKGKIVWSEKLGQSQRYIVGAEFVGVGEETEESIRRYVEARVLG